MPDHLPLVLGLAELATALGIARSSANVYRQRGTLPPPDLELACGPIWTRKTVERLIRQRAQRRPT